MPKQQTQTPEEAKRFRAALRAQIEAAMARAGYTIEELASALGQRGIAVATLRQYMSAGCKCPLSVEYTAARLLGFKGFLFTVEYGATPPYSTLVPPKFIRPDAMRQEARKEASRRAALVAGRNPKSPRASGTATAGSAGRQPARNGRALTGSSTSGDQSGQSVATDDARRAAA